MRATLATAALASLLAATASAQTLRVSIDASRSRGDALASADAAVRVAATNFAQLTKSSRELKARYRPALGSAPFFMPLTVKLTSGGRDLAPVLSSTRGTSTSLTLAFDSTGSSAFPAEYQTLLQNVFNAARPTMDLIFGAPAVGGTVHVANFDATIGDRQAVAGGFYVPNNGSGVPEIRFPVYSNPEAAAVNFIHTLLLAYMGPNSYAFDPFQEGLVRAATMRIVRSPGVLAAGLDADQVEAVLQNSYDVSEFYDWNNQPGLEGPKFIAPNLLSVPLPSGGSVGGPYLLKYKMAGTAWEKVLAQYPNFIALLNQRLYAQPSIGSNPTALTTAGQAALNQSSGTSNATVEGFSLSEWIKRQYALHTWTTRGEKLLAEVTPITSNLSGSDFGVFLVEAHYFRTTGPGNEILLSGASYPIFWEGDQTLNRIFPSAQEDRMDIAGAYGSVVPNLPNLNGGQAYRAIIDVPVGGQLQRVYVPAGAIATPANTTGNNFYGTVIGAAGSLHVKAMIGSTVVANVPVVNGAFGVNVSNGAFLGNASVLIQVLDANSAVLHTRRVNKGPGGLAVDLRVGGESQVNTTLPEGLTAFGVSLQPYVDYEPYALGLLTPQTLVARYNPTRAAYDLFPEIEGFRIGHGYFLNLPASAGISLQGRTHPGIPMSVALKPGWNMIADPRLVSVPTTHVQVVHAADNPQFWNEAAGTEVGTEFFRFTPSPGANPQTGSYVAVPDATFRPGVAYYVRVLNPDGVTLLFEPPTGSTTQAVRTAEASASTGWRVSAQLIAPNGSSMAVFGESATAAYMFDREDSGIPPSAGGLQVVIQGVQPMYRDIRRLGTAQTYKLHLEGLVAGQTYSVRLLMAQGSLPYCTIADPAAGVTKAVRPPAVYTFVAKAATRDLSVSVPGGTQ